MKVITGRIGSGKSILLVRRMCRFAKTHKDAHCIYVVPVKLKEHLVTPEAFELLKIYDYTFDNGICKFPNGSTIEVKTIKEIQGMTLGNLQKYRLFIDNVSYINTCIEEIIVDEEDIIECSKDMWVK